MSASAEVVDLVFALQGRAVALDYADRLREALQARLPWLAAEVMAGVHPLAGVSAGDTELYLTRRARLVLRLARHRAAAAEALRGARLDLGGTVEVGTCALRELAPAKVLYSSFVTVGEADEQRFLAACAAQLAAIGVAGEPVCGKARRAGGRQGFSLMLHGLRGEESLRLQHEGLGGERQSGCGIFVPHKGVAAVGE